MSTLADAIVQAAQTFTGQWLQPADLLYNERRHVHNGLIDKRPALIACCHGVSDVVDAVKLARLLNLEVAVRGGGHNVAGRATIDKGLTIDLSPMKGMFVDVHAKTARAQGGVLWKELNRETQLHGLATTGGVVGSTGIAGLTLGGGLGWLMPKYGLALDNLRAAELVMADGRVARASADEHADLFWAVRGGGGNFGIATSLEYTLHEVGPNITGGVVAHPLSKGFDVLRFYRDQCAKAPDELMLVAGLQTAPDGSNAKIVGIVAGHCGSLDKGEKALAPLKAFGPPVMDALGPIPYSALNGMIDGAFPKGALNYWKAHFLTELTDDAVDSLVEIFLKCPSPLGHVLLEHFHGAAARVPVNATAYAARLTGYNAVIIGQWTDPKDSEKNIAWVRESYAALKPFFAPVRYMNYLEDDAQNAAAEAY